MGKILDVEPEENCRVETITNECCVVIEGILICDAHCGHQTRARKLSWSQQE
jgi:hypothetical protein